jgi:hypothetical protein
MSQLLRSVKRRSIFISLKAVLPRDGNIAAAPRCLMALRVLDCETQMLAMRRSPKADAVMGRRV